MAKRSSLKQDACPVARAMELIGDCWTMLIIRNAMLGQRRFSEFQKDLGLAKNILSDRLRVLVADGIFTTEPAADGSAYQDYVLTDKGRAVFPIMVALRQWGEAFAFSPGEATNILVDRKTGKRVPRMALHAADGRPLGVGDTRIKAIVAG
ncbi:helix-turn-helix domain-containing protein [Tardiphaga sp.]|uniref:winged helix-turn-helix transcriptional regulator n=1 Tax=Tardiphaga sp. TaxID=1926292 RepID=UPI002623CB9F|nr:helix-turn-helix domain-containing protein [Tardiphaga sp.]MDB5619074.1 transcriptional regulator [Tardiphaga sp.]